MTLGADAFSKKPFERRWLLEQLRTLTGQHVPRKVLVIDEQEVSRYLLRQLFPPHGGQVLEADNGNQGLRFARDEQPHLILLDLLMPSPNGFEILERLKTDPRTAEIPVVVSSAKTLTAEEKTLVDRQAAGFLSKSALTDGSAISEMRGICQRLGLSSLMEEPAASPAVQ